MIKTGLKRIHWIDWAKFFAITFVVWGHISPYLRDEIYMFHIPLFFMISGYLYRQRGRKEEVRNVLFSLVLPYLIYNLIYFIPITGGEFKWTHVMNVLLGNQEALTGIMIPLWFIVVLILIRLLCATHINLYALSLLSFITSILLAHYLSDEVNNDYFQLQSLSFSLPFFCFGYFLRQNDIFEYLRKHLNSKLLVIIALMLFVAGCVIGKLNTAADNHFDIFSCYVGENVFVFYFVAFLLAFLFMLFCCIVLDVKNFIITRLSNGTLLILGVHLIIYWKLPKLPVSTLANQLLDLTIILFISYWMIWISERYCPVLIGKNHRRQNDHNS